MRRYKYIWVILWGEMSTTNNKALVSVIIPAYNQGPMLAEAISSALAQTYTHVEVIVVNDGSTDPCVRETASHFARQIVYIERENGGVAAARQTGLRAASGGLIALLDQDDRWLPHKLTSQVRDLAKYPRAALAHSSYYLIDREGKRTGVVRLAGREWRPLPSLLMEVPVASGTALMRREAIERAGGFDPSMPGTDDWDLWLRMSALNTTFVCSPEPLTEYREHEANTSRNLDLMISSTFRVLDKFYALPQIPQVALRWRERAYARRHAWAAANLYGNGRLEEARAHLIAAAQYAPESVTSLRSLRSMIHTENIVPTAWHAQETMDFILQSLPAAKLPQAERQRLEVRAMLIAALYRTRGSRIATVSNILRLLSRSPRLLGDKDVWLSTLWSITRLVRKKVRTIFVDRIAAQTTPCRREKRSYT